MKSRARYLLLVSVLMALMSGCEVPPTDLDDDPDNTEDPAETPLVIPRIGFGTGGATLQLYDGDRVSVRLLNDAALGRPITLQVISEAYRLLWTSEPIEESEADLVVFSLAGVSPSVPRGQRVLLTAAVQDTSEIWYYATDGNTVSAKLGDAAVRPAILYDGTVLPVDEGAIQALAVDADRHRVFYANSALGQIGALKLQEIGLEANVVSVGSAPNALDYRDNTLVAVVGDGAELSVLDTRGDTVRETRRILIPAFFLRVEQLKDVIEEEGEDEDDDPTTTFVIEVADIPVQPYARNLSLSCVSAAGGACTDFTAFGASGVGGSEGRGVMRRMPIADQSGSPAVVPIFKPPVAPYLEEGGQDTIPAFIDLISGTPPQGSQEILFTQASAARCISLQLGAGPVVASPLTRGPVFAAAATPETLCGDGTRVVRIDGPDTDSPTLSDQAVRNMLGEDRIGPISEMKISGDGKSLLLLGEGVVYILDDMLRVRGRREHPNAHAISWLEEAGSASAARFAVADPDGVTVYETGRLTAVGRAALGALEPHLMSLVRVPGASSSYLVVGVSHGARAFVVARLSED